MQIDDWTTDDYRACALRAESSRSRARRARWPDSRPTRCWRERRLARTSSTRSPSRACGCWPGPWRWQFCSTWLARTATPDPPSSAPQWAGAAALAGYAYAFAFAYTRIDAGTGALMLFGAVQLTMTGWGIARGERPRPAEWVGLSVAVAGLVVLTRPGRHAPDLPGAGLMAAAGACWGFYSLLGRQALAPLDANFHELRTRVRGWRRDAAAPLSLHITAPGAMLAMLSGAVASGTGIHAVVSRIARPVTISRSAGATLRPGRDGPGGLAGAGRADHAAPGVSATMILGGILLACTVRRSDPERSDPPGTGGPLTPGRRAR